MELANGFHELGDAAEQRRRFQADRDRRAQQGLSPVPLDERLIEALEAGLPDCAGVALGVDRLAMCLFGVETLRDVLAFDWERA
jgi:lysyl-tRNA synthetase class 2